MFFRSLVLVVILFFASPSFAVDLDKGVTLECLSALEKAAGVLVKRDFPSLHPLSFWEVTKDDLTCMGPDAPHGNIGIVVFLHGGSRMFGIFHFHYNMQGEVVSAAPVNNPVWQKGTADEFWASWCDYMRWSEKSFKEQRCEPPVLIAPG